MEDKNKTPEDVVVRRFDNVLLSLRSLTLLIQTSSHDEMVA